VEGNRQGEKKSSPFTGSKVNEPRKLVKIEGGKNDARGEKGEN